MQKVKTMQSFEEYSARQERWLNERPVCVSCGHHIQDEYMYDFGDGFICEECKDEFVKDCRKDVDAYVEEVKGEW